LCLTYFHVYGYKAAHVKVLGLQVELEGKKDLRDAKLDEDVG
jgi:hypothetical protein